MLSKNIRRFCCFLAYKIYKKQQEQPQIDYKILQSDLRELEKEFNLNQLFTFNSRSLLGKYTTNFYENSGENLREEYYRYGFIHKAFFEFFLLEYQYILEKEGENANEIDFINHTLASEIYIIRRWKEKKDEVPATYSKKIDLFPINSILTDSSTDKPNYITRHMLYDWFFFLYSFTKNKSLESFFIEKGMELVMINLNVDFGNFEKGFTINNSNPIVGDNNNFWDEDKERPSYGYFSIPFFRNFINGIYFFNMNLKEEYLKCFEKAINIEVITIWHNSSIESTHNDKKRLEYFKNSYSSLKYIKLEGLNIEDRELLCFEEFNKVEELDLKDNCLLGDFLDVFKKSVSTLRILYVDGNPILSKNIEKIMIFKNLENLHIDRGIVEYNHHIYQKLRNRGVEITFYEKKSSDEFPRKIS